MNEYKNLTKWCADYSKQHSIKIYPQSAPLQLVMEDMLGQIEDLRAFVSKVQEENLLTCKDLLEAIKLLRDMHESVEKNPKKEGKK